MQRQSIALVFWSKQGNNRKVLGVPYRGAEIKTKITRRWDGIALSNDDTSAAVIGGGIRPTSGEMNLCHQEETLGLADTHHRLRTHQ